MSVSEFLKSDKAIPDATITYHAEDLASFFNGSTYVEPDGTEVRVYPKNNEQKVTINFYNYTDWKSMITVEVQERDEDGNWTENKEIVGRFYVLSSYLEKLISDAQKLVDKQLVVRENKY